MDFLNQIVRSKLSREYSQFQKSSVALMSLLGNKRLWAEFDLLEKMTPKIAIRLRNSPFSRALEQLSKMIANVKSLIHISIFEKMKIFFHSNMHTKAQIVIEQAENFNKQIELVSEKLFYITLLSGKAFKLSQIWLDLGQLINHFIMISCTSSRICIFCKTLLVYLYDMYQFIFQLLQILPHKTKIEDRIQFYLRNLNIKFRANPVIVKKNELFDEQKDENVKNLIYEIQLDDENDLGVPMDRNALVKSFGVSNASKKLENSKNKTKKKARKTKFCEKQVRIQHTKFSVTSTKNKNKPNRLKNQKNPKKSRK